MGKTFHVHCSGFSGDRDFGEIILLRKCSWKGHISVTHGKQVHTHCSGSLGDRVLMSWYDSLLRRWSWKVSLSAKKGKTLLCLFIAQFSQETKLWVNRIVLFGRWSWKNPIEESSMNLHCSGLPGDRAFEQKVLHKDGLEKAFYWWHCGRLYSAHLLCRFPGRQCSSSWYNSFNWKMVMKRPFVCDTGEASACSFRSPVILSLLSWYDSVTWNMVLKRPFVSDTGETSALSLSGL